MWDSSFLAMCWKTFIQEKNISHVYQSSNITWYYIPVEGQVGPKSSLDGQIVEPRWYGNSLPSLHSAQHCQNLLSAFSNQLNYLLGCKRWFRSVLSVRSPYEYGYYLLTSGHKADQNTIIRLVVFVSGKAFRLKFENQSCKNLHTRCAICLHILGFYELS